MGRPRDGVWQRLLLKRAADEPFHLRDVLPVDATVSELQAVRRAAHSLAAGELMATAGAGRVMSERVLAPETAF